MFRQIIEEGAVLVSVALLVGTLVVGIVVAPRLAAMVL